MQLSAFGQRFGGDTGIMQLMQDLGETLAGNPDMIFMGGGNPARIPAVESVFRQRLKAVLDNDAQAFRALGLYQAPPGDEGFRQAVAEDLRSRFGWPLTAANVAVSNGSQSAFFALFNLLAGTMPDGSHRHIRLPLVPEYIGYSDIGLVDGLFKSTRPCVEMIDEFRFRYRVDFDTLAHDPQDAAWCLSRPTNPSGNVISDEDVQRLDALASARGIPLIIDGAYGMPYPSMVFNDAKAYWSPNVILMLSLSKLGLPAVRTGVLVADEALIDRFSRVNTVMNLATGSLGPVLGEQLIRDGTLQSLSERHIRPFYEARSRFAQAQLGRAIEGLDCRVHASDGAMFLWLWAAGLPGGSRRLYQRLKERGVLVVPGDQFFPGLDPGWQHASECIRISFAQDEAVIASGMQIIGETLRQLYQGEG